MSGLDYYPPTEVVAVIAGIITLLIFALVIALPQGSGTPPGSKGHRPIEDDIGHEEIRADGFIDSFSGEIEEAGGGLPLVVKLALPGVLIWWLLYLIFNWAQTK
jgi:hypothetical protein